MVKKVLAILLLGCLMVGLVGCGNKEDKDPVDQGQVTDPTKPAEKEEDDSKPEPEKKDITISMMHFWASADETLKEIAKQFQEETGITVEVYNSSVATHLTDLNTRAQTDDVPEIFTMWPGASVPPYIDSNVVADLSGSEWESTLQPFAKEASTYDGKLYLAPVNTTYLTLAYNVDVFERLNLKEPTNQEEFEHILEVLKNDSEVEVPFIQGSDFLLNVSSVMFTSDIYQKTPNFDALVDSGEKAFNGEEVFNLYKKLLIDWPNKGYINADTALATDRMGRAVLDFIDGKAGIMSLGSFDLGVLEEMNTENTRIAMFPYPAVDNHGSLLAAAGEAFALSGYAEGEKREAAIQFLNYLMLPENNSKLCKSINSLSALEGVSVETGETLKNLEKYNDQPTHGWMVWPMEVQNNLKNLGDVLTADPAKKEEVLQEKLDQLQDAWNMK